MRLNTKYLQAEKCSFDEDHNWFEVASQPHPSFRIDGGFFRAGFRSYSHGIPSIVVTGISNAQRIGDQFDFENFNRTVKGIIIPHATSGELHGLENVFNKINRSNFRASQVPAGHSFHVVNQARERDSFWAISTANPQLNEIMGRYNIPQDIFVDK